MEDREQQYVSIDSQADQGFNIHEYLLILLKRRWLILVVLILATSCAGIYSLRQKNVYRSTAVLYIDIPGFSFLSDMSQISYWQGYDAFFNTQYKILESKALARRVAKRLRLTPQVLSGEAALSRSLKATKEPTEEQINSAAATLLGMVRVVPVKETRLTNITFSAEDPELAMTLANTWAEEYREYSLSSQYEYTQKAQELLESQVKILQSEIAAKEKMLREYSLEKKVVKLRDDRSMNSDRLENLNAALLEATRERVSKEVHYEDLRSRPRDSILELANSPTISQLKSQLVEQERMYREKLKTYKADYPEMIRLNSQIDQTAQKLQKELSTEHSRAISGARAEYQESLNHERALENQLELAKRDSVEGSTKEVDYDRLKLEIDNKKQLLTSLIQRRDETGVSMQVQEKKATLIRIVDEAERPKTPYSPNISKNLMFGVLIGLIAGIGLTFALEYLDRSLKTPYDVERYTGLPLLGVVPQHTLTGPEGNGNKNGARIKSLARRERTHLAPSDLFSLREPESLASEAIRTVRTSLLLSFPGEPPKSILITSSRPGEGKTFIACNMAIALAHLNKRVVVLDADMRNPRMHRVWKMQNDVGLSRLLTSQASADDVTRVSAEEGISIITSGPRTPRPAELLSSFRFDQLMDELSQKYDYVIVDSPPLLPVTDSVILAAKCSTVVLVIRGGETPRDLVHQAKAKLAKSDPVVAGAILNCVNMADPYYYYGYYSYYRKYYGESEGKSTSLEPKQFDS